MKFFNILKELRAEKGLTQTELAKALGITRSRLSMYETGDREPDFETLELFADFFNVDVDYLLGRTEKTTRLINHSSSSAAVPSSDGRVESKGFSDDKSLHLSKSNGFSNDKPLHQDESKGFYDTDRLLAEVRKYGTDTPEQRAALSAALDDLPIPERKRKLIQRILQMDPKQVELFLGMAEQMRPQ